MKLAKNIFFVCVLLTLSWATSAQDNVNFYKNPDPVKTSKGLRLGVNYSVSTLGLQPNARFEGIRPSTGFYIGSFYSKEILPDQLSFRLDALLQRKGAGIYDINNREVNHAVYYYAGVSPQIGLQLARNLNVFIGPECNLLVVRNRDFGKSKPIEIGATVRLSYFINRIGIEASYFRGFTTYDRLESFTISPPIVVDFYNQNTQIGLIYKFIN